MFGCYNSPSYRKRKKYNEFIQIASRIKKVTDKYNIPLIINDNLEVSKNIKADGIHIGQNGISCLETRKNLGSRCNCNKS